MSNGLLSLSFTPSVQPVIKGAVIPPGVSACFAEPRSNRSVATNPCALALARVPRWGFKHGHWTARCAQYFGSLPTSHYSAVKNQWLPLFRSQSRICSEPGFINAGHPQQAAQFPQRGSIPQATNACAPGPITSTTSRHPE
jgi:hypothetical protein